MKQEELRPIGTEFWYEFLPDMDSNFPQAMRIKYRVIEHTKIVRFLGDKVGEMAERWEPILVEPLIKEG